MIKKLHFKALLLLCAMIMGIGSAWGETKSVDITPDDALNQGGVDPITVVCAKGDGTSNPAISSGQLRLYQAASGKTTGNTITFSSEKTITSIVFTFANDMTADNGAFSEGSYDSSTSTWTGSTNSVTLTVTGTTSGKRIYITAMTVYYDDSVSQLTDSDFSLTGAPVALSFDLYDDAEAQVISYTTSSTGAVTVSASEYIEAAVNETSKTITVTPLKKTSGAQTITVSQAADDDYKAGSATFTVTIADSTPTTGSWVLTDLADLTEDDVFVIVGNNGSNYAMSNDEGTGNPPLAVAVTIEEDEITSDVDDNIKWNISGDATNGYTFYPNGSTTTWLYCTNTNNGVRVGTNSAKTFVIDSDYLKHSGTSRYVGIYSSQDWRCYTSINSNISGQTFAFYKYVDNSGVQIPSITASNVSIAYDATTGEIAYTLKNAVADGSLSASVTSGDWLNIGTIGETIPFTCEANTEATARTATVTLTYTYGDNETVTKDVTVTQAGAPVISSYSTIPELFAAATSTDTDVNVTFGSWVVSGVSTNGKTIFVTDNNGNGFVIYSNSDMSSTYSVGSVLSGTVSCTLKKYNGFAELLNVNASDLTITAGGAVSAANIALADLAGVNTGALVSYQNLTCSVSTDNSKYYLSDGTTTLQVYNTLYAFGALEAGKTYNITGIYQQYNNTKEILPRSAADIEEVGSTTEPTITVDPASVSVDAAAHEDELDITYENLTVTGTSDFDIQWYDAEGAETSAPDWIYAWVAEQDPTNAGEGYVVHYDIYANEGDARTVYFKVFALDDEANEVYSNLITITQAKRVASDEPVDPAVAGVGAFVKVTSTADITAGNYLIVYEGNDTHDAVAFNGALENLDVAKNGIGVDIVDGKIPATDALVAATFTLQPSGSLKSASGLYIGRSAYSNGLNTDGENPMPNTFAIEGGSAVITAEGGCTLRYNYGSNDLRFRYYKTGQQPIQLYKYDETATPTITAKVTAAGYATFCSEYDLDFENVEGLTAYRATVTGTEVSFDEVTTVPAREGVLLKGDEATYNVPVATSAEAIDNDFIGVTVRTLVEETGIFVLMNTEEYGVGFYKTRNPFTVGAHTAYLPALAGASPNFIGLNETTGISDVNRETMTNNRYFDLQGRSVAQPTKGLYIVNGKKVVVK